MADKKVNGATAKEKIQINGASTVSSFTFGLFIYFNIDFFLHFSQRIPGYGFLRPTLILVLLLTSLLYFQRDKFIDVYDAEPYKRIKYLIIYLALSFVIVRWPGSALNNLPDFVKAICFFFFTALAVDTTKRLKIFLFVFIGCQIFRVFEPLFLNISEGYWGDKTYVGDGEFAQRLSGAPSDVINPNELGFVIATIIPFIYYLLWGGKIKAKLLFLLLLPPLLYALILTMSRGALLALVVVGWFVFRRSKYKTFLIAVAIGLAVAGWTVMTDIQKDRYLSLVSSDTIGASTAQGRVDGMLGEFVLGLTSRPIFGNGLGTTTETKYHEWGSGKASHNLYAELLIEIGFVGAIFFLSYIFRLRSSLRLSIRDDSSIFWKNLNLSLNAVFWMYVVYSVNYYGLSQYYWYLFGGLVVSYNRIYKREMS